MLVLIDESGDSGFKLTRGSSPLFVLGMVTFVDDLDAHSTSQIIGEARKRLKAFPEFKFSNSRDEIRDEFFKAIGGCKFTVRTVVVQKKFIYRDFLRENADNFYNFFVKCLLKNDGNQLNNASVKIDGSGNRQFKKGLRSYLTREMPRGRVKSVKLIDSCGDNLIQLADMCVGAIARSYKADRNNASRWYDMIGPKLTNVWMFR
jgi:hypothetical protein